MTAFVPVACCLLVAGCGPHQHAKPRATTTAVTTTPPAPPVGPKQLRSLLLHPEDVNPIMGVTDMKARAPHDVMPDDSGSMEPPDCLAIDGVAQEKVYAGSGYSAVREQMLSDGEDNAHFVDQAVVLFPTAKQATDFFDASVKQWPACEDYRHIQSGSEWVAGEISDADGMLRTITTQQNAGDSAWQACGRAMTVRNNVVVDVNTCSTDPKDSAVVIADRIAAKVPIA
ncbi:sensor domain-containing protein [Mycobacterium sp. M1]|uniref:Sensor domain-containing protein n=1 Tax=Mycolicibacter acidiphilus TaxID=2835306 RepID=A0ABS5RP99_9MYCO|nr:sensor domain-containing protein [Mycolicibacter acidiphilus]MBS9534754.1 sensor domain-containing protein [Mycolicibacter acidiphilus]